MVAQAIGDIPQNVNFAIKASRVRSFLDANGVGVATGASTGMLRAAEVAAGARAFTVLVECWK